MPSKIPPAESPGASATSDARPGQDEAIAALTGTLQQLRGEVLALVSRLAQDAAVRSRHDELRAALERDVSGAATRLRDELTSALGARGEDLDRRTALIDQLLSDLGQKLAAGSQRLDDLDRRLTPGHVQELVTAAAKETADRVYTHRFQGGLDALGEAFGRADDRLQQLRTFIEEFGPGGLPVVTQERDALRMRVAELVASLEAAQKDTLELRTVVADRDAAALRRRVVEGIDPEVLDRRLADVAARERDLEARGALAADNQRLNTELERNRAALERWEQTGREEHVARVEAAQLERYRDEAARADHARQEAERGRSRAERRMREAEDLSEQLRVQLRELEQERASAEERTRRLDALVDENLAFARQFEEQARQQSELSRAARDAELGRGRLLEEISSLRRDVETAMDAGKRAQSEAAAEALGLARQELQRWAEAEAESRAQGHVARAETLRNEAEELRARLTKREGDVVRLTQDSQSARAELSAAKLELEALPAAHAKRAALLEEELRASGARVLEAARIEAQRLRDEGAVEVERLRTLTEAAEQSRKALELDVASLGAQKGELDAQIESARADLWELKQRVVPTEERIRSLEQPVFLAADLSRAAHAGDETAWLSGIERGIKEAGFVFHQRLVHAFHTSLKIAHHAPLVVLAGISGTGKSELPRLYADLGGVPFLPVSVQPSWDSPHDLFGFFNYTDGRLKAEPLARLFRQTAKTDDALRDSPSLVLLDEMNLARVEYYFADLLSKLEARRAVRDSKEPGHRRRASVLMDAGPDGGDLPLYLDERVLFVGTMNQDESTLTLSDKVLDRACVLTFPAPRTMHLTVQKEAARPATRLAWTAWSGWIREPSASEDEQRLNEINRLMAELGRPFGHRLFRAIHAYVANYPGSKEYAFSDQFAMKILPRLGGLECENRRVSEALSGLERLVPSELQQAFGDAREREFFAWGGAADLYQVER